MKSPIDKIPEHLRIPVLVAAGVVSMMFFTCCGGCALLFWNRSSPADVPPAAGAELDEAQAEFDRERQALLAAVAERARQVRASGNTSLNLTAMKRGDVGQLTRPVHIDQVIGGGQFLGSIGRVSILFTGIDDRNLVDDRYWETTERWFLVLGPQSYETVTGAKRTVIAVMEIPPPAAEPGI